MVVWLVGLFEGFKMIVLGYGRLVDGSRRKVLSEDSSQ
jgi:hypothetical protein